MSSERPAKRIRQACEPCRRKKSRCPGEKPTCSHCARLQQNCFYADERLENGRSSVTPSPQQAGPQVVPVSSAVGGVRLEDRLKYVESQLHEVLANQISMNRAVSLHLETPRVAYEPQHKVHHIGSQSLPTWEVVVETAEAYIQYCDCQPLPLFSRQTFVRTLKDRQPEIIFSMLALATRHTKQLYSPETEASLVNSYAEEARALIFKKVLEGTVELPTIQALCLLTLVYFTDGHTRKASIQASLAISLAHNANLTSESLLPVPPAEHEERRCCFWSLLLLKRLHGADFTPLDLSISDTFPAYPSTTTSPPPPSQQPPRNPNAGQGEDLGIVAYAIQLSDVWFKITRYARRRGKPSCLPPWSAQSEYAAILAEQMDFETRMPFAHRFEPARFSQRSVEDLDAHGEYWGPWLFVQFLYHTNLCLLNHPLLLSLRLRNFKCVIPEIFLQHTADLIASHASWIINFIDMLAAKPFRVTDPFLGHCVAVIATIYLQESFVDDQSTRAEKQAAFEKCLGFIRELGERWPHLGRIATKLHTLSLTVSSTQIASELPTRQNRKLLIDLGQFFEILEYSSSSSIPDSAAQLFGPSLSAGLVGGGRRGEAEMAQTSVLPQPTRVEGQEFGSRNGTPRVGSGGLEMAGSEGVVMGTQDQVPVPGLVYSDDELAVLAESFFHQRNEFGGGDANWWQGFGLDGSGV